MDTREFKVFVDNLVDEMQPGAVLNYFRTNRAYSRQRFYRVRLKAYKGDVRTEFARRWLILGAGVEYVILCLVSLKEAETPVHEISGLVVYIKYLGRCRLLLSSRFSMKSAGTKEILNPVCHGFVQKPFSMGQLSQRIHGIMGEEWIFPFSQGGAKPPKYPCLAVDDSRSNAFWIITTRYHCWS